MNTNIQIFIILSLVSTLILTSCSKPISQVCFDSVCVNVKIADTLSEQTQGLMYEKSLDGGMLFKFDKMNRYYFWMQNTLISLDMVWLDNNMELIYIEKDVPPCEAEECPSYGPSADSMFVIEVNAGFMDANKITYDSKVEFRNI